MVVPSSATGSTTDRYNIGGGLGATDYPSPYGYLPSFFAAASMRIVPLAGQPYWQQPGGGPPGANWNLLMELVETSPPFADSEKWVDPTLFSPSGALSPSSTSTDYLREYLLKGYLAPFSALPTYQNPGKVNLNTIPRREVWDAVEWNYDQASRNQVSSLTRSLSNPRGPWDALKVSRRGYNINSNVGSFFGTTNPNLINPFLDANTPSQFAGAFRPGFSANIDVAEPVGISVTIPSARPARQDHSIYTGLMRPKSTAYVQDQAQPLIPVAPGTPTPPVYDTNTSLISPTTTGWATLPDEINLQPFVNYQRMMRLPNLVTNQSNVFAVWVTVGLFEYDDVEGIGAEYIGPSGRPERTKSFYIIDRSIPVGFAPGKSFNSDKTVLLRRKIPR